MKKLAIYFSLFIFSFSFDAVKAQVVFSQNFETTKTAMPAGWHQQLSTYDPTNLGWQFDTIFLPNGGGINSFLKTNGSYIAFVNDLDNNGSRSCNSDTLYTSSFSTIGYSHLFVSIDVDFIDFYEAASLLASKDGGLTWSLVSKFPGNVNSWGHYSYNFDAFTNQANVMLAMTYNDNCVQGAGLAIDNISVHVPTYNLDMGVTSQTTNIFIRNNAPTPIQGMAYNYGSDSITHMHLNYAIDGGAPVTDAMTSILIQPLTSFAFNHSIPWTPKVAGIHTIKIWTDQPNGGIDQNMPNDTLTTTVMVVDSIVPKQVVLEEFMQASCSPCLWATPNLDAVLRTCIGEGICNPIRYHVDWPGVDYMNNEIDGIFMNYLVSFYNLYGVPEAFVDGSTNYDPAYMYVPDIETEATKGSPIKINIASATYDAATNLYKATVEITSYTPFPSGLIARSVLTVDTIKYDTNQSSEDPTYAFKPPIGTFSVNGDPDTLFQYLVNFPNVAEAIMPSDTGAILNSFTAGQTQTLHLSWKKNHPWGLRPDSLHYDSLFPGEHLVVYVQTLTGNPALGLQPLYIYQSASEAFNAPTSIEKIPDGIMLNLYPNPTSGNTTLQFKLAKEENVTVELYSMLGERLWTQSQGKVSSGAHFITIPCKNLQSGIYFVKLSTDNTTLTKKLVMER